MIVARGGLVVMPIVAVIGLITRDAGIVAVASLGWLLDFALVRFGDRRGIR